MSPDCCLKGRPTLQADLEVSGGVTVYKPLFCLFLLLFWGLGVLPVCVLITILEIQPGPFACGTSILPQNYSQGLPFDFFIFLR